jgi:hypothetical protein
MQRMLFQGLTSKQQGFLTDLKQAAEEKIKPNDPEIPVYAKIAGQATLIEDWLLPWSARGPFGKSGSGLDLYRGGAGVFVYTMDGIVGVPDERSQWIKPLPIGISTGIEEGADLSITAIRELTEELFVMSLDQKFRYLPTEAEAFNPTKFSPAFNLEVTDLVFHGNLSLQKDYFNEPESAYENIFGWDISDIPEFTIACQEDWFKGGNSGIVVVTVQDETITKVFSGQQGAIPLTKYEMHPAMKN